MIPFNPISYSSNRYMKLTIPELDLEFYCDVILIDNDVDIYRFKLSISIINELDYLHDIFNKINDKRQYDKIVIYTSNSSKIVEYNKPIITNISVNIDNETHIFQSGYSQYIMKFLIESDSYKIYDNDLYFRMQKINKILSKLR